MPTVGGWTGKTLRVDLTTRAVTVEKTLEKYDKFWGGTGMGYKVLWDETTKDTKPTDPECPIIFGWGPLAGTGAPSGGRTCITSLSPQHMHYAVATGHMGGHFAAECKFAGWDGIIVTGKASGPVYIAIRDAKVEIVDCPQLWGQGIYRTTDEIQQEMGGGSCQVAAIGQAGENLVAQSVIMTNYSHSAGGQGAVMGAKNLKGIGVIGTGAVKIAGDKRAWKTTIDNVMAIIGSNNQAVVPNTLQAWAEYSPSNARWYAAPGKAWGAANPPVDTGICDPHDRQKVGYRCFKADLGVNSWPFTVRMDGCHSCPIRCHQMVDIPTAAKWGVETTAQNTCTGWWGRSLSPNPPSSWSQIDKDNYNLERYVVGKHMTDDFGVHNNYGTTDRGFAFILGKGPNGPVPAANQLVKVGPRSNDWSWLQLNVPDAEWNKLTAATGFLGLYKASDLRCLKEFGRIMAAQEGEFGKFMAGPVEEGIERWKDADGNSMAPKYRADSAVQYWMNGFPKHHSFEDGGQVGALMNTGYNRDAQIHSWVNVISTGLPKKVLKDIAEVEFARVGWGAGMKDSIDADITTPVNEAKARAAKFGLCRKELHDSLGLCNWMWPFAVSPLKERGYRGDLSLESKMFSIATGRTMNTVQFDREGERFYTLQRALTIRSFESMDMRTLHDRAPAWGFDYNHGDAEAFTETGSYYVTDEDWENSLDLYYEKWGYDKATGAPTRATLESLDLKFVADELEAAGLLPG